MEDQSPGYARIVGAIRARGVGARLETPLPFFQVPRQPWWALRVARRWGSALAILGMIIGTGLLWQKVAINEVAGHNGESSVTMTKQTNQMLPMSMMIGSKTPAEVGIRVEWLSRPATGQPGQAVTLIYRMVDSENGETITDLPISHERPMHLIIVSRDLTQFRHIHPELAADGSYQVETMLPQAGTYLLFNEFTWDEQPVLDQRELIVGQPTTTEAKLAPDRSPKTANQVTASLTGPEHIRAGEATTFALTVTKDGQPVTDLAPYLGAAAHVAIVAEDGDDFAHTHGEVKTGDTADHGDHEASHDQLPTAFGPEITIEHTFSEGGRYKIWVEFNHGGTIVPVAFVVEVY